MVMFGAAFAPTPFVTLLVNFLQLKVDGYKVLALMRRPTPVACSGIGVWLDVGNSLTRLGVVTHSGMIVFTMNLFDGVSPAAKIWRFGGFCFAGFGIHYCIQQVYVGGACRRRSQHFYLLLLLHYHYDAPP